MRRRSVLFGILAVGSFGMFEFAGLRKRFLGRRRFRFLYAVTPQERAGVTPPAGPGWTARSLKSGTGQQPAMVARAEAGSPWVVYFPGNDLEQLRAGVGVLDALRARTPLNCVALTYRGFDGTAGVPRLNDICADLTAELADLMQAEQITPDQLHIVGFSIGGYFAAWVAAQLCRASQAPASVTLFAPGADLVMVRPSPWDYFAPGDDYQMAPFLDQLTSPTLVLQGSADDAFAGPELGKAVADQLGSRARYAEFEGVRHSPLLEHEPALAQAAGWIAEHQHPA